MAESLLFSVAESLIGKIASRAVEEASLALGVHRDLQQMKVTMSLIKAVLLDAEQKKPQSSALSEWLSQIKPVFSDAENILDDKLPSYLKRCFAGFALCAEDRIINSFTMCAWWEANGFLPPPNESETVMDIANQFVRELQSRSFLTDFLDLGSTCNFKLHDLVRDLAVFVGKGEFQKIYPHCSKVFEHAQHLRFLENNLFEKVLIPTGLRSLFSPDEASNEALLKTLVSRCKYLRYLYLVNSKYKSLPHSIGKLKHLRYLNLANSTELEGLPVSLYKLQNLQCLDLRGCTKLHELPKGLGKLSVFISLV